jgi:hypothetical protein
MVLVGKGHYDSDECESDKCILIPQSIDVELVVSCTAGNSKSLGKGFVAWVISMLDIPKGFKLIELMVLEALEGDIAAGLGRGNLETDISIVALK